MISRNGIYYDLSLSIYQCNIDNIKYHFSSKFYQSKFLNEYINHRNIINSSLSQRFSFKIQYNILADIVLYGKIEKRGFYLVIGEDAYTWQDKIILDGVNLIKLN